MRKRRWESLALIAVVVGILMFCSARAGNDEVDVHLTAEIEVSLVRRGRLAECTYSRGQGSSATPEDSSTLYMNSVAYRGRTSRRSSLAYEDCVRCYLYLYIVYSAEQTRGCGGG